MQPHHEVKPSRRPDAASANLLLRRMTPADLALLSPHLETVTLDFGMLLARAGEPIETICFMEGALAGFLDVLPDGRRLTIGVIGREGMVGWPLVMGNDRWPYDVEVRARTTTARRMPAERLLDAIAQSPTLRELLLRFAGTFMTQMGRTIVSNLIHPVESRAARWILLYHDRIDGDEIILTHEELGAMLGVRRASITTAFHALEGHGAIKGLRGRIVVRDRALLEMLAGDTYGYSESEYRRLIG